MTLRFTKATRETGVDGHFTFDDPQVVLKLDEVPTPLYPEDDGFWDQFNTVIDMVGDAKSTRQGSDSGRIADCLEKSGIVNVRQGAMLVHDDWPTDIMRTAAKNLGAKFHDFGNGKFTNKAVMLDYLLGWAARTVSPNSFAIKWHFMVPRPEEVAGSIARGEIDCPDVTRMKLVQTFNLDEIAKDQRKFTMYVEGCPDHPAFNAMHAAAAGCQFMILSVMFDLTDAQRQDLIQAAYNMAHFRSNAGVHYPQDNDTGLWVGQEVMARTLADEMARWGFDRDAVQARVDAAVVDWLH